MQALPPINLKYPVLLHAGRSQGSGFFVTATNGEMFLVTAKHVLHRPDRQLFSDVITVLCYVGEPGENNQCTLGLDLGTLSQVGCFRFAVNHDVVAIKVGENIPGGDRGHFMKGISIMSGSPEAGIISVLPSAIKQYADVLVSNEVYIFGYPTSLGLGAASGKEQFDPRAPLLRRGAVAGKYDPLKTIILDCPAYPGNSGGPIMEVEWCHDPEHGIYHRYSVIGVVSEFVPYMKSGAHENSGYSVGVPMDAVVAMMNGQTAQEAS